MNQPIRNLQSAVQAGRLSLLLILVAMAVIISLVPRAAGQSGGHIYLPILVSPPASVFGVTPLGSGFDQATSITHAGDARLFVAERAGRIKILHPDGRISLFLDISDRVLWNRGEYGMFDVAFHPDYGNNGFFYISYTTGHDDGVELDVHFVVARFRVTADPNVANPDSETRLFYEKQSFDVHKGGELDFDKRDNYLYVGHGDDRLLLIAQDIRSPKGKIFRLKVDDAPAEDILDATYAVSDEVWAMGLRNPWRFDVDEPSGQIYIGEVGDLLWEEINIAPLAAQYFNYGWPCMEGPHVIPEANDIPECQDPEHFIRAVYEYSHRDGTGRCAIIGGKVYRPVSNPNDGRFIFGDMCTREVFALSKSGDVWQADLLGTNNRLEFLFTFGEDYQNNLYLGTGSSSAPIYRLNIP
jgi:glucose/arabinose dehydrogenase